VNYDLDLGKLITSGVDVWLNTPLPPLEASGTSGMKAAVNGVPSLSVLDGWWIEGWIEGITGWSVGPGHRENAGAGNSSEDASSLYQKLEDEIIPTYYDHKDGFVEIMRHAIALNGFLFQHSAHAESIRPESLFPLKSREGRTPSEANTRPKDLSTVWNELSNRKSCLLGTCRARLLPPVSSWQVSA